MTDWIEIVALDEIPKLGARVYSADNQLIGELNIGV